MQGHRCDLNWGARDTVTQRFVCRLWSPHGLCLNSRPATYEGWLWQVTFSFLLCNMEIKIVPTGEDSCAESRAMPWRHHQNTGAGAWRGLVLLLLAYELALWGFRISGWSPGEQNEEKRGSRCLPHPLSLPRQNKNPLALVSQVAVGEAFSAHRGLTFLPPQVLCVWPWAGHCRSPNHSGW